ncbi:MAG TPA: hypothetical protein VJR23_07775 [Candidatus Acidoferrales bacterium]|nr:hypothetical protein [Candidatus Acidoferrales bacterium]
MPKEKMVTVEHRAVGSFDWENSEQARIERNLVALNGRTWEALRFCKHKNGRHNRVHLVIEEENFVELFRSALENHVFSERAVEAFRGMLSDKRDPFLSVIGSTGDGNLSAGIDDDLYGDRSA